MRTLRPILLALCLSAGLLATAAYADGDSVNGTDAGSVTTPDHPDSGTPPTDGGCDGDSCGPTFPHDEPK